MIKHYREQLCLESLRLRDQVDSDFVAFMIGLAALLILGGTVLTLYGGYYLWPAS
jgi:hypothetical protein